MTLVKLVGVGKSAVTDEDDNLAAEIDSCIAVAVRVYVSKADGSTDSRRRGLAHVYNSGSGVQEYRARDIDQARKTLDCFFRDLESFEGDSRREGESKISAYVVGIPFSSTWNFMSDYVLDYLKQRKIKPQVDLNDQRVVNAKRREVVGGLNVAYKQIVFKKDEIVVVDKDAGKSFDRDDIHSITF